MVLSQYVYGDLLIPCATSNVFMVGIQQILKKKTNSTKEGSQTMIDILELSLLSHLRSSLH